ncbi:TlyA family RNA methyltransferase [Bacillus sp. GM2]|jgi:23S rRNA (cytidine1920-2'-O)/16S rRNA (cytidine1409-2'-O)-methyltransferase|uniref:RNA binding methyltransferase FtsJ like protein n=2 Tax=Bacillus paralicheniformis TaxID=1648923 RepID=A0A6N2FI94_9BACI|nr:MULTISPECIES: TlyA family RNA methyltransferase [Bacillus]KUL13436.1 rRNA methyltransferase [Bacillus licheniformis LMG 7559]KUL15784.1 rRNA methyltransferase [Bacillus licheniformis LMG 6934]MBC8624875.1 TlyA family RNA methyltransferase [Robertmurraya crescens]POO80913.1 TlyA family rRNA (cytidine-2'-O)-methyltransferase [Bacillus sp. MBGLi97]AGN37029.1 hemolysin-like protein YqxC [Bacillus paralicheniformis ATCC 9945a]
MTGKKERLDVLLVERGLMETREKAKRAIMAGIVYTNENRLDKPGEKVDRTIPLTVKGNPLKYVSRGGLKLEKALKEFQLSVQGKLMIDIGSSTGGFTDCALQNGALRSYAVDVGYNQLAWKLRQDERVVVMERTNFRYCTPADFTEGLPEFATIDVSFISLKIILPVLKSILVPGSDCIALVKPQFEAGRESVGKKGIVRDPLVHQAVLDDISRFAAREGYDCRNVSFSPITGGDGNIEFLLHLHWDGEEQPGTPIAEETINQIVEEAHKTLKAKKTDPRD